jgi:DNA mismatch repair protein MutS
MMRQYRAIKERHKDAILFYRMGDFYEMFFEDAKIGSKILGITLTKRNHGGKDPTPLAGFPHHALDRYTAKLIKAGHKVAICEQTEDPKLAKTVVKRDVVELITAGTTTDPNFLAEKSNNYLVGLKAGNGKYGICFTDVSTGEFYITEVAEAEVLNHLLRLSPSEFLYPEDFSSNGLCAKIREQMRCVMTPADQSLFHSDRARETLCSHFGTVCLEGFGCEHLPSGVQAAGAVLAYIKEQKKTNIAHISKITPWDSGSFMVLDSFTLRNLELLSPLMDDDPGSALVSVMDYTRTSMGARLLRRWISAPLVDLPGIHSRLDAVETLLSDMQLRDSLKEHLDRMYDLERLVGRIGCERANCRDLLALRQSLEAFPEIHALLHGSRSKLLEGSAGSLSGLEEVCERIRSSVKPDPPLTIREGNMIMDGYSRELDDLRMRSREGKEWISSLQARERERTGISSLKVGYNKVFGYYIEVSKTNQDKVPQDYIRKQTLVNGERYITPDLKEWESKVLNADEEERGLEYRLFIELRNWITGYLSPLRRSAEAVGVIDVIYSLSLAAERGEWCRPEIKDGSVIDIRDGRHPVVEQLDPASQFIPNSILIGDEDNRVHLITGPNMAGKSTFLRQVGIITLMAQTGSYVPAKKAEIGVVNRIFTRVGAWDRLAHGQSTFLVEMQELACILNNMTEKSLLLLDEIGRGTSTFDGISIAWALVEHLCRKKEKTPKTLFATHYHELTELPLLFKQVKNFNISVKEWNDEIIFLRRIEEGGCDHSYGIQVARLAGVPEELIKRAKEILINLEEDELTIDHKPAKARSRESSAQKDRVLQLDMFDQSALKTAEIIRNLDVDNITPLEALMKIKELKDILG